MNYEHSLDDTQFQKSEIGNMKWFTFDMCIQKIRHYNIEKINLLKSINQLIQKYNIF